MVTRADTPTDGTTGDTADGETQLTARQKAGHVIGALVGLDMFTTLVTEANADEPTPWPVLVVIAVMALSIVGLLARSWVTGRRRPRRIATVLLALNALLAAPGLFVADVATWMRIDAGLTVVGTIAAIVLMFYPERRVARV
ncbi:hypothetical protein ACIB24_15725 [Spongisporangium articulatum]|uniref:Integral membrane protein n=1 Tax=Spongisporangium articulatum TaxID=3362603 RepID=A0ABW8AQ77_9ACTN